MRTKPDHVEDLRDSDASISMMAKRVQTTRWRLSKDSGVEDSLTLTCSTTGCDDIMHSSCGLSWLCKARSSTVDKSALKRSLNVIELRGTKFFRIHLLIEIVVV